MTLVSSIDRKATVLSPHPDDAVYSAWHALRLAPPATVITIFGGVPGGGTITSLDQSHGAVDSAAWMRRRLSDDRAVLASIPATSIQLSLLDAQYRAERIPSLRAELRRAPERFVATTSEWQGLRVKSGEVATAVTGILPSAGRVYGPLGVGRHPDHVDVATFAVDLARQGRDVWLYADSPYFLRYGLPSWIGDVRNEQADQAIEEAFHSLDLDADIAPVIAQLASDEVRWKIQATRRYSTEFEPVDQDFAGVASDPNMMCYEVYWKIPG